MRHEGHLLRVVRMMPLILALLTSAASLGCGQSTTENGSVLTVKQAKEVLEKLPFRYNYKDVRLPRGATGAVAGKISGPRHTSFAFSLTLGKDSVPIPVPESGVGNAVGVKRPGFIFNSNTLVKRANGTFAPSRELGGQAQLHEAGQIQFRTEEALCRAAIHKPCPV
jgi:hypothetical protein